MRRNKIAILLSVVVLITSILAVPALASVDPDIGSAIETLIEGEEAAAAEENIQEEAEPIVEDAPAEEITPEENEPIVEDAPAEEITPEENAEPIVDDTPAENAPAAADISGDGKAETTEVDTPEAEAPEATESDATEASAADAEELPEELEETAEEPVKNPEVYINGIPVTDTYYDLNTGAMAEYDAGADTLTIAGEFENSNDADTGDEKKDELINNSSIAYLGDGELTIILNDDSSFSETRKYGIKTNGEDLKIADAEAEAEDAEAEEPETEDAVSEAPKLSLTALEIGIDLSGDKDTGDLTNEGSIDIAVISGDGKPGRLCGVLAENINNNPSSELSAKVSADAPASCDVYAIQVLDTLNNRGSIVAESADSAKRSFGIYTPKNIFIRGGAVTAVSGASTGLSSFAICADGNLFIDSSSVSARAGAAKYNSVGIYGGYTGAFIAINSAIDSVAGNASDAYAIDADKSISIVGGSVSAAAGAGKSSSTGINTMGDISIGSISASSEAKALAKMAGTDASKTAAAEVYAKSSGNSEWSYAIYAGNGDICIGSGCDVKATADNKQFNKVPKYR